MKEANPVQSKSEDFAIRVCKLYEFLKGQKKETVISKQILRSGTSIGANIAEALYAESNDDFIHKLKIARKEANETSYWLKLLYKTDKLSEIEYNSINADCQELIKILSSIILTSEKK